MACALIWLGSFAAYLMALTPGLGGEDSGEFVPAFATLGSTHPPGYPLFVLLGRLALLVPAGSPAFRANLFSAGCAAGALSLLFLVVSRAARTVGGDNGFRAGFAGLAAVVLLGSSPAFWYQAVISDKYPLHLLLFSATLTTALRPGRWGVILLLAGLGAAHHPQILYVIPALIWIGWRTRAWRDGSARAGLLAAFAAASLKLLEAPIRGIGPTPLVFDPPRHWDDAWRSLSLRPYAHRIHGPLDPQLWSETLTGLGQQLTWVGAAAGIIGLLWWAWRDRTRGVAALLATGTGLVLVSMLAIFRREYHALPVAWLLCAGTGILIAAGGAPAGPASRRLLLALALVPGWQVTQHLALAGHGRAFIEHDYGRQLLGGLGPRAVLFVSNDDHFFSTLYQQTVLRYRTDVLVIPRGYLAIPFLKARTARSAPELAPVLAAPFRPSEDDRAARAAVDLFLAAGRPCYTTSSARREVYAGLRLEPRDAVYEMVLHTAHHPATALWYPTRRPTLDPLAMTWKHQLMEESQANHQAEYARALLAAGRGHDAVPRGRQAH